MGTFLTGEQDMDDVPNVPETAGTCARMKRFFAPSRQSNFNSAGPRAATSHKALRRLCVSWQRQRGRDLLCKAGSLLIPSLRLRSDQLRRHL